MYLFVMIVLAALIVYPILLIPLGIFVLIAIALGAAGTSTK